MKSKHLNVLLLLMTLQSLVFAQTVRQTYQLDVKKSKMLWNTGKLMGGHNGYLVFSSGSLRYSTAGEPLNGSFVIDMNNIRSTDNTEEEKRQTVDANLRKQDFFASDQFPAATVLVKKIIRAGNPLTYNVTADLTIKGISNPIEFTAKIDTRGDTALITGNIDINRARWGIHSTTQPNPLNFLSGIKELATPDIHVSLDLVLTK